MTFSKLEDKFGKANCKLVGLSIDGLYSHIAWLRTIKDKIKFKGMENIEVKIPLIEDITMEVAKKIWDDTTRGKQDPSGTGRFLH